MERTIYLAGELFSLKHLAGNASLATEISRVSDGRYRCILPQDFPQGLPAREIRDADIRGVLGCDAGVFHYDGLELDSGTVVEYMFAKFADLPAVLLRTDFRNVSEQPDADPWNLMTSFYPRTERVWLNSLDLYHDGLRKHGGDSVKAAAAVTEIVARQVCGALDRLFALPPVLPREMAGAVYDWLALMPGSAEPASKDAMARLYKERVAKGLL
jgi:nucleoside 2-deoxyribosyltransferase